jgi:Tol biopolymer transport system component
MSGDLNAAAIYLVDVEAGTSRPLLPKETAGNFDPTWSPDGSQMAFVSTRSGNSEIWVANVDGTNLRQLTNAGQFVRFPYWRRTLGSIQP